MARIIDKTKISKLEEAAISLVVEKGYASSSVLDIAKKAGISAGYLYSHYKSKEELILSIYEKNISNFDDFIDNGIAFYNTIREFTVNYVGYMFNKANEYPDLVRFLQLLVFDRTFNIPEMRIQKTREQCKQILKKGIYTGEISKIYTPEDIYIVYFAIPFKLLEHRLSKNNGKNNFNNYDIERVTEICIKALK
ncbi:MAG: TetR/AcrR family transcriptional regulator [Spirochaetes bacterium]|nr:TetR/AcrR family transcriptional regulator [Spirochaetota bacterium]